MLCVVLQWPNVMLYNKLKKFKYLMFLNNKMCDIHCVISLLMIYMDQLRCVYSEIPIHWRPRISNTSVAIHIS